MDLLFSTPIPVPWLLADDLTVAVTVLVLASVIRKSRHAVSQVLEAVAFVFLYAGLFENGAVVQGWYGDILWLVLLTTAVHWALLAGIYAAGRRAAAPASGFVFGGAGG